MILHTCYSVSQRGEDCWQVHDFSTHRSILILTLPLGSQVIRLLQVMIWSWRQCWKWWQRWRCWHCWREISTWSGPFTWLPVSSSITILAGINLWKQSLLKSVQRAHLSLSQGLIDYYNGVPWWTPSIFSPGLLTEYCQQWFKTLLISSYKANHKVEGIKTRKILRLGRTCHNLCFFVSLYMNLSHK